MTERSAYWDGAVLGDAAIYPAPYHYQQYSRIWRHRTGVVDRTTQGVIYTQEGAYNGMLAVTNPGGDTIRVAPGCAEIDGIKYENTANVDLTASSGNGFYRVVIHLEAALQTARLILTWAAGAYVAPVQTEDANGYPTIWEIPLAEFQRAGGVVGTITDIRDYTNTIHGRCLDAVAPDESPDCVVLETSVSGAAGTTHTGTSIASRIEDSVGVLRYAGRLMIRWTNAVLATLQSRFELHLVSDAATAVLCGVVVAPDAVGAGGAGDNRGNGAVDWQGSRTVATQVASGINSVICGGRENTASGLESVACGGDGNTASGAETFVGGGNTNVASADYACVGGGINNTASNTHAFIGGGNANIASATYTVVCGGSTNDAIGNSAAILGGATNTASGDYSTSGGGVNHTASGNYSTTAGGNTNTASGTNAAVGGGFSNAASGTSATVPGGDTNTASGTNSAVGGGYSNIASGTSATVPGGNDCDAAGNYALAAGNRAKTGANNGVFIWADSEAADFTATAADQFAVRASGGSWFKQNNAAGAVEVIKLEQIDDDKPFVDFVGTSAADQTKSISTVNGDGVVTGPKDFSGSAGWAFVGMVRIEVNGAEFWMPYYQPDLA